MNHNDRLTPEEHAVLDKLREAHNLFLKLPVQHPNHQAEWVTSLHHLQRMVMARQVERDWGLPAMQIDREAYMKQLKVRGDGDFPLATALTDAVNPNIASKLLMEHTTDEHGNPVTRPVGDGM